MNERLTPIVTYLESLTGRADLSVLQSLLEKSDLKFEDIAAQCKFSETTYKRNTYSSSEWYDLVLICWRRGQASSIHDHAGSSCAFKILKGDATEIRYQQPKVKGSDIVCRSARQEFCEGQVCAAEDSEIHKIVNESGSDDLVTLHIYSPPLHMSYYRESESEVIVPVPEDRPAPTRAGFRA